MDMRGGCGVGTNMTPSMMSSTPFHFGQVWGGQASSFSSPCPLGLTEGWRYVSHNLNSLKGFFGGILSGTAILLTSH